MLPYATDAATGAHLHLDPADLTRHAVCLGMTGSGKTGLCVALLESVTAQGVPLLCLDPKGDLTNLALQFPGYPADDLVPWVDPVEAARSGSTPQALAAQTSTRWRRAQHAAGLSAAHHQAFVDRVEVHIYTPGAETGVPIDVLSALTTPPAGAADDPDTLRLFVSGAVTALLGLVDVPADPMTDPPAILLSRILMDAFTAGQSLTFDALLAQVVDPPFAQLGVFGVDQVMPRTQRRTLALQLNAVLAAPAFAAWRRGVPLDLDAWLVPGAEGRTPIRVLTLAHLNDRERMFFVSILLHTLVAWTRRQEGTGRLRALMFFDEVFGFLPPHPRNPSSKEPLLRLLKQARSVGVGVALATQNPVDLDYKALSNAGTWFIGRLQTEQDRARVLDGLSQAGVHTGQLDALVADLPARAFVWRGVKGTGGVLRSRQTLSLLRGPLTRQGLARLTAGQGVDGPPHDEGPRMAPPTPEGVHTRWLRGEVDGEVRARLGFPDAASRQAAVLTRVEALFDEGAWHDTATVDVWVPAEVVAATRDGLAAVQASSRVVFDPGWVDRAGPGGVAYGPLPRWLETEADHQAWVRRVREAVVAEASMEGPNGAVRAEFGDVRVIWVGVVWG